MSGFEELTHGRYLLKTGPRGLMWQARAYLKDRQVGQNHVADSKGEALDSLRAYLDERDSQISVGRGPDGSPSALEYAEAFDLLGKLPAAYEAMLEAHLEAPDHCITATQLAEAAGYENYNAANLHYGTLGQMVALEIGYNPPCRTSDGSTIWTGALAVPGNRKGADDADWQALYARGDDGHFLWRLRPQVVEALRGKPLPPAK